jgi:hypothetical protein
MEVKLFAVVKTADGNLLALYSVKSAGHLFTFQVTIKFPLGARKTSILFNSANDTASIRRQVEEDFNNCLTMKEIERVAAIGSPLSVNSVKLI